jgi:hypothetical protein
MSGTQTIWMPTLTGLWWYAPYWMYHMFRQHPVSVCASLAGCRMGGELPSIRATYKGEVSL